MILAAIASVLIVVVYVYQDGAMGCMDGDRYISKKPQPTPFHRRFCGWNETVLRCTTWISLVSLGILMGNWQGAVLLLTLPGAWFCATHPTTVDAVTMVLALLSASLFPGHPVYAVALSLAAGFIHERAPVYAALYAWSPALLIGLLGVGWWRRPAASDHHMVGHPGIWGAVQAHKAYQDYLDMKVTWLGLRGLLLFPLYFGTLTWHSMAAFALATGTRAMGTDSGRMLFWAAPMLIKGLPELPPWAIAVHVLTFRRCI